MTERNATTDGIRAVSETTKGRCKQFIGKLVRRRRLAERGRVQRILGDAIGRAARAEFEQDLYHVSND
ncbi:hypothetical protein [Jongsikchunia kroppenstedtii]|uniref:hypothetical protein n=1 Tax=Jongsikchunia kroppenstedtii TaxID=1121721 RepID=UPI0003739AF5|nr:hypothetical protein [Jongsikchunia kroppenstedtii]